MGQGAEIQKIETIILLGQGEDAAEVGDAHPTSDIPHPSSLGEALH